MTCPARPRPLVAVSLKMYLSAEATRAYVARVAQLGGTWDPAGLVEVAILPTFPLLESTAVVLGSSGAGWGAQDVAARDHGAQTGEVSAGVLAELGCRYVEVGHAERRALFKETREDINGKLAQVVAADMTPLYCVGEQVRADDPAQAARVCLADLGEATEAVAGAPVVVAYEPVWAIGAPTPADPGYVRSVCERLREAVRAQNPASRVIYGGAAGPGTFTHLAGSVDGLFLGRFAHDADALAQVVQEVAARSAVPHATRRSRT